MLGYFFLGLAIILGLIALKWAFEGAPEIQPFTSKEALHLADLEEDLKKCVKALERIHDESKDALDKQGRIAATTLDTLKTYDWGNR